MNWLFGSTGSSRASSNCSTTRLRPASPTGMRTVSASIWITKSAAPVQSATMPAVTSWPTTPAASREDFPLPGPGVLSQVLGNFIGKTKVIEQQLVVATKGRGGEVLSVQPPLCRGG